MLGSLRPPAALAAAFLGVICAVPAPGSQAPQASGPPGIVFLLLDDMGYADVGAYGNAYHRTPNIDRLAAEGMRFTDAYAAAPNCSPTRASILTGRWPARTGITQYLPGNVLPHAKLLQAHMPLGLPLSETLIAEPLGRAGYVTASIGKWHLGAGDYLPEKRGFHESFAASHWGSHRRMFAPHPRIEVPGTVDGDYLTDSLTRAAESFLERSRGQPFFLYLPYYAVHSPIQAKPGLVDGYSGREDPSGRDNAVYAAMVEGVDRSVGRILAKLDELGIASDTAVFFFSDNGGVPSRAFNGGLRSGKGFLWEGGIREPLIVRWPRVVRAGAIETTPVTSVDFYPTFLEMAGAPDVRGHWVDGVSLLPLFRGDGHLAPRALYWHYPHYSNSGAKPSGAIRRDGWKLLEFFEDSRVELYDLAEDRAESVDRAGSEPARASALLDELRSWRESVRAAMPLRNPDYQPARSTERRGLVYKDRWDPREPVNPLP